ncbi:zinc-dependent alcohol dehydrogenase [Herbiconiux solani]|uniref:zinc-dependent alcohol dehydrogenase n=1 Tax=Herbiconiux solani TaxID=661329 RepID=UPI0008270FDC|nr:alcohol dehydrogenase catalytic domain-containing protein [Herbiconiux solani]
MDTSSTFSAVELRGDGRVAVVERPVVPPGAGQLRIAISRVGLCATDKEIRDGVMVYFANGMAQYPIVPGHEWVGTVVEVGPDVEGAVGVEGFAVGDRVVGECSIGCGVCAVCASGRYHLCPDRHETGLITQDGGLAEEVLFTARAAHRVPAGVDDVSAALIEPTAIALNAVKTAGIRPDDRVLVIGAGPIGLLALQLARDAGAASVEVADLSARRLAMASELGADDIHLGGPGYDPLPERWTRIIEATGQASGLAAALGAAVPGAVIVAVSLYGRPQIPFDADALVTKDLVLKGALGSPGIWDEVIALVASGRVRPAPLVTRTVPFGDVAEAFDLIGGADDVKIVVEIAAGGAS